MIIPFEEIQDNQSFVGSKAFILAQMSKKGLPVPSGIILSHEPDKEEDWNYLFSWWKKKGSFPLAVRSSAFGEDSKEMSFAGQNQSFLNVKTEEELKQAILKCFKSIDREASKSYRKFFTGTESSAPMNVVLQQMVQAKYSGVYFTENPLNREEGAVLEYIEGFGEKLVSGYVNPYRALKSETLHKGLLSLKQLQEVFELGEKVSNILHEKIDMEWAIDQNAQLFLLQARPITASRSLDAQKKIIKAEYERIEKTFNADTWWDGQTFCEWTGTPSYLSYDVWRMAFMPGASLDSALHELGYTGFEKEDSPKHDSILDLLYGRPYVNMAKILPLYFGPIPYVVTPHPKAHLKFSWSKVSAIGILKTPLSLFHMIKVGWKLSTQRKIYIERARKELLSFKASSQRPNQSVYEHWTNEELLQHWEEEILSFSNKTLKWPLVIAVLIEATERSLEAIVKSIVGHEKSQELVRRWMGTGIRTVSFEMSQAFRKAMSDKKAREFVLASYGHRGPGEMDLLNPRWEELGLSSFDSVTENSASNHAHALEDVESEVHAWKSLKESVVLEEWRLLKDLLELREQWKMALLKPYAHIRYLSLEISKRYALGQDIFMLSVDEVKAYAKSEVTLSDLSKILLKKKEATQAFKSVYLSDALLYSQLKEQVFEPYKGKANSLRGLSLSGGLVKGRVKIVQDLSEMKSAGEWPEDTILVAKATDPGWTPLLTRVKGVVVERGGVLSHCAIVAREMNLPALNVGRATQLLKDGDTIFLDADKGSVYYDSRA